MPCTILQSMPCDTICLSVSAGSNVGSVHGLCRVVHGAECIQHMCMEQSASNTCAWSSVSNTCAWSSVSCSLQCLFYSGAGDGMLLVHDLQQGQLLYGLGANGAAVRCTGSTQNRLVAAGDDGKVRHATEA